MTPSDTKLEMESYQAWQVIDEAVNQIVDEEGFLQYDSDTAKTLLREIEALGFSVVSTPSPAKVMTEEELDKQALKLAWQITYSKYPEDVREQADQIINLAKAYKDGAK